MLLPLSLPGLVSGALLVYSVSISALVTPALMGGRKTRMRGNLVYDEVLTSMNWPFASSIAVVLLVVTGAVMVLPPDDARPRAARGPAMTRASLLTVVVLIYLFLLAPLIIVVAVSFDPTDAFRFPPSGVSLRWYAAFFASETFVRAFFRVSLVVAVVVSMLATAVGGLAAIGLVRFLTRGRTLVNALPGADRRPGLLGAALFLYYSRIR